MIKIYASLQIDIHINGEHVEEYKQIDVSKESIINSKGSYAKLGSKNLPSGSHTFRLEDLAYTRSGDKGNSLNIGYFLYSFRM